MDEAKQFDFSEEDREKIAQWLNQFVRRCPVCGNTEFRLEREMYEIRSRMDENGDFQYIPGAAVACRKCAHVMLFDSQAIGISAFPLREDDPRRGGGNGE